jgi:hypothetical protein
LVKEFSDFHFSGHQRNSLFCRPIILDRFNTISGDMAKLAQNMKSGRLSDLRKLAIIPFLINRDPDPAVLEVNVLFLNYKIVTERK